jgi:hypothetical protein
VTELVSLPLHSEMADEAIERVIDSAASFFRGG